MIQSNDGWAVNGMTDREKTIKDFEYQVRKAHGEGWDFVDVTTEDGFNILKLLKENEKEIKALRLLVEWAEECDFGFDQFPIEYERYKDEIKDMKYTDGMIHIAKRTLKDNGAFEEGR